MSNQPEQSQLDPSALPAPVCERCGFVIDEDPQDCHAVEEG